MKLENLATADNRKIIPYVQFPNMFTRKMIVMLCNSDAIFNAFIFCTQGAPTIVFEMNIADSLQPAFGRRGRVVFPDLYGGVVVQTPQLNAHVEAHNIFLSMDSNIINNNMPNIQSSMEPQNVDNNNNMTDEEHPQEVIAHVDVSTSTQRRKKRVLYRVAKWIRNLVHLP